MPFQEIASAITPVEIAIGGQQRLSGDLAVPPGARSLVVFAHGSGSSRHSRRNQRVAALLNQRGLATLLTDLLTPEEAQVDEYTSLYRFDIPRLASRLVAIIDWAKTRAELAALPIGLFGASTGAGAALIAASERPAHVAAVVSRGGRPDLADAALSHVVAPTLLIVGGLDTPVIALNRQAMARMPGSALLEIVPGASHLFEEPGTLDRVAELAGEWFASHCGPGA